MSCKYCEIKMRPLDEDTKVLKGESWKDELGYEGGYIGPSHDDKFRMIVNYDAGFACTGVPGIKYCPFCGAKLATPAEPLIKDEKIRKAVRAWAEANDMTCCHYECGEFEQEYAEICAGISFGEKTDYLEERHYTIAELCGEEE